MRAAGVHAQVGLPSQGGRDGAADRCRRISGLRGLAPAPNAKHPAPRPRRPAPSTQHLASNAKHSTPNAWHWTPGAQHVASGTKHSTPNAWHWTHGTQHLTRATQKLAVGIQHLTRRSRNRFLRFLILRQSAVHTALCRASGVTERRRQQYASGARAPQQLASEEGAT